MNQELYDYKQQELIKRMEEKKILEARLDELSEVAKKLFDKKALVGKEYYIASEITDFVRDFHFVPDNVKEMKMILDLTSNSQRIDILTLVASIFLIGVPTVFPGVNLWMQETLGVSLMAGLTFGIPSCGIMNHLTRGIYLKTKEMDTTEALTKLEKEGKEKEQELEMVDNQQTEVENAIDLVLETVHAVDNRIEEIKREMQGKKSRVDEILQQTKIERILNSNNQQEEKPKQYVIGIGRKR